SIYPKLTSATGNGHFQLAARTLGAAIPDASSPVIFPLALNATADFAQNLGGSRTSATSPAAASNQLLATFDLDPQSIATNSSYTLTLDPASEINHAPTGQNCFTDFTAESISPSITLTRGTAPHFTSANSAIFTVGFNGSFQVVAEGTPAPALSISGVALPTNVTFTPGTGLLNGIPQLGTVGTYNVTFTATNANPPAATQNFTLIVQKANQAISFGALANKNLGDAPFTVSATTNAAGLSVSFDSGTPATCSVSGNTVTLIAPGICTVNANQAGNANYNPAATVAQSFTIVQTQFTYTLVLEGAQETPANISTGTGSGTAVVDTVNNTITLNATFSGIGSLTGAHFHGPAARGVSAGVKIGLTDLTSPMSETVTYLEADEAAILAGNWYLNLHTSAFPGGELRAQLDNLGAANKTLTTSVVGTGSITGTGINCPGDCTESYAHNTVVALTATPGTGYSFTGWSGACSGTGACNVTMDFLKSVTATFTINSYLLTTAVSGSGTGTISAIGISCPSDCTESFSHGTMVTLTAGANAGSSFAGWSGACSGTGTCAVTMDVAKSVTATFTAHIAYNVVLEGAQETPPLAVTGIGGGTAVVDTVNNTITLNLTYSGLTGPATAAHLHGPAARGTPAGVKLNIGTASPITNVVTYLEADEASILSGAWYVNIHTTANGGGELRGQLDNLGAANKMLSVVRAGTGEGSVTGTGINCPADCNEAYGHNTVVLLTANPAMGSTFAGWSGGGCSGTGTCSVTMNFLKTVTATFTLNAYTVTPSAGANGTISPSVPVATNYGTTLAFTVTPDMGYTALVTGTCGGSLAGNTYTTNTVAADCTVVATFAPNIALVRVESRKLHGAFTCNLPITTGVPIGGNVSIEPRNAGAGHHVVFVFDTTVTALGGAAVTPTGTANATYSDNEVRVILGNVPDGSRVTVSLTGVNGAISPSVSMGFLRGDVTNSSATGAADIATVKSRIDAMLTTSNCAADLNADGQIKSSDVATVKSRSGSALP
ncbi:MAG: CHRD domain-containing protein, partial [Betaproteobacteria bacterium]|nr:CHRD domain-containing protein [Betaproteobacteria bacterium]